MERSRPIGGAIKSHAKLRKDVDGVRPITGRRVRHVAVRYELFRGRAPLVIRRPDDE